MATVEYWIQIENRPWDVCPHNIDRMTGQDIKTREGTDPIEVTLTSPGTGKTRKVKMFKPLTDKDGAIDALILRRYKPPTKKDKSDTWTVPDDRKVNPWDLNEPDPTDKGTMGTIPGPVVECNVGDKVIVHFRNRDMRTHSVTKTTTQTVHTTCTKVFWEPGDKTNGFKPHKVVEEVPCDKQVTTTHTEEEELRVERRTHSLHPHGFAFLAIHDGAYPLSPADKSQPVGPEKSVWDLLNVKEFKKGDRVPPLGTFIYTWIAGAPSEEDPDTIEPWPTTSGVWLYHDHSICDMDNVNLGAIGIIVIHNPDDENEEVDIRKANNLDKLDPAFLPGGSATGPVTFATRPLSKALFYFPPPSKALYLQLFHALTGLGGMGGMLMNGRQYLGNTPTLIAGPETLMRFGVIGMGNDFHTFHIHGHRWVVPGPDGHTVPPQNDDGSENPDSIQNSPQIRAVSQFEDTRIFGPANSFVFTMREGEFFGARDDDPTGEFHMHCHVLMHMDMGMMGSLLIVPIRLGKDGRPKDGGPVSKLPEGVPCLSDMGGGMPPMDGVVEVSIVDNRFDPPNVTVKKGGKVRWTNNGADMQHTATSNNHPGANFTNCSPSATEDFHSGLLAHGATFEHTFNTVATHAYHCDFHGCGMSGTVKVT
jgi:plastocyanin